MELQNNSNKLFSADVSSEASTNSLTSFLTDSNQCT